MDTEPKDARIKILNIGPKFFQGIELKPGDYRVEVSAEGYEAQKIWVSLSAGKDKTLDIRLKRVAVTQSATSQDKKIRNSLGMEFVFISPDTFMMGSAIGPSEVENRYSGTIRAYEWEHPQHRVTLTSGYYMQATEVTQKQWKAVMGTRPWSEKHSVKEGDNYPAVYISWNDCQEFIKIINQMEGGYKYRLPTEAEWEYACRAGSTSPFSFGGEKSRLGEYAWYKSNSGYRAHRVAQKKSNAWGLFDMHGNVSEWCQDWYGDYPSSSVTDPKGPLGGSSRVYRSGEWDTHPGNVRSANRDAADSGYRTGNLGFRLLRTK